MCVCALTVAIRPGTVLTIDEARACVDAGAQFLVSPVVDEDVIRCATALGVVAVPGCATPSEMWRAHRAGAQLQKLFPAQASGAQWVRQTLAPMPFLRIVPTSGVSAENARDYLDAGAFAVGFVNTLFEPADLAAGRFDAIRERAARITRSIAASE